MNPLPLRSIVLLVILSLAGIFIYQAYWLMGLYRTMHADMERSVREALRMSDYTEMLLRIRNLREEGDTHGSLSVSAGYDYDSDTYMQQSVIERTDSLAGQAGSLVKQASTLLRDTVPASPTDGESSVAVLAVQGKGLGVMLGDKRTMTELAAYLQRGLHSGLDALCDPDVEVFDSLLTRNLHEAGIDRPHRLEYLHRGLTPDSTQLWNDTIRVCATAGYRPTARAQTYEYAFDMHEHHYYRLTMEPDSLFVLRQMAGILATSLVILLILAFAFWYLVRTLLRQKTLDEMKSDFTNNITHELKTPIAVAYAANDALLNFDRADDRVQRERYLRICQEQLQRLGGLVEQILSLSMERRKTFRLQREELSLRELLESLAEQHRLKADKPVALSVSVEPENLTVRADRTHFANILSNLIDNAIKYSPERAEVSVRCRPVADGTDGCPTVEISVADHGIGLSPEQQRHVFDKFYRVPRGNRHDVKGYGLGLFYVRTMVEKHGGNVRVSSEAGKGSVFTVRI